MTPAEDRMRRCITMAMGCLSPLSDDPDERLAWYRLLDALDGKEPRNCLTYDLDPRSPRQIVSDNWDRGSAHPSQDRGTA